jgi:hypothetical protein
MRNISHHLLRLYPAAWRDRYADEFAALLDDCPSSPALVLDVLLGALDARLRCAALTGKVLDMAARLRSTAIAVFCAYIAFVVAGIGYQKMSEYEDFTAAGEAHPIIGVAHTLIAVVAGVALLAVLAGGLPLAFAALRFALTHRRRDVLALFAVPVGAFAALVVYGFVALQIANQGSAQSGAATTAGRHLFLGLIAILLLGAIASSAAVSLAIARSQIGERIYRFALAPTIITALAMAVMFAADLAWGLGLRASDPALFAGNGGIVGTSTAGSWLVQTLIMGVATAVALYAVARALPPRRATARLA